MPDKLVYFPFGAYLANVVRAVTCLKKAIARFYSVWSKTENFGFSLLLNVMAGNKSKIVANAGDKRF